MSDHPEKSLRPHSSTAASLSPEARELRAGLTKALPEIPCSLLYDEHGSELFERITHEPEYYQTRTELAILEEYAGAIAAEIHPTEYIELGAGSGRKTHVLLDALHAPGDLTHCTLLDISGDFLQGSVARLAAAYPELRVRGLEADFLHDLKTLGANHEPGSRLVTFFAGTLGNLHPDQVPAFLTLVAQQLAEGDGFLVGIDLIKDSARLDAAYNDAAGVTAAFNKNVLTVLNRRFGADFPVDAFEHHAFYDAAKAWVDIRVRATRAVDVHIDALDLRIRLEAGQEIRTELSCKYSSESFSAAVQGTGFEVRQAYTDPERLFADVLLVRTHA